jgi:hypothetical protein
LAADGYDSQQKFRVPSRSHLSPDGGGLTRTPTTAWQQMDTIRQQINEYLPNGKGLLLQPPLSNEPT